MTDIFDVKMSPKATKNLKKVPLYIALKLDSWIESVGHSGLAEVNKHDY